VTVRFFVDLRGVFDFLAVRFGDSLIFFFFGDLRFFRGGVGV
tara:strand:- start:68453 stop:68578 length:126 start_codon:yes stop_codon:yes gene_type:complete